MTFFATVFIGLALLISLLVLLVKNRPKSLPQLVSSLGDLRGRSMASIIAVLGQPHSVTRYGDDTRTMVWQSPNYQIALSALADGSCGGVEMEHSGTAPAGNQTGNQRSTSLSVGFSAWTEI